MSGAEPCLLKLHKRWLIGLCVAAILAAVVRPAWETLVFVFEDPLSNQGAAVVSVITDRPERVWIVAVSLGATVRLAQSTSGRGYSASGPSQRGTMSPIMVSAYAGRQRAEIRYRVGDSEDVELFHFEIELVAQSQCDVIVQFAENGPHASACGNHRPASYGGTWRH